MKRSHRRVRGITAVEMSLLLPILLLLAFGMIEYGWMFVRGEQIADTVRQAIRVAAKPNGTSALVQTTIDQSMQSWGFQIGDYTATWDPPDVQFIDTGHPITLSITVPYENISLLGLQESFLPTPDELMRTTVMVKEGPL
jgi:hypothetical protein